MRRRDDVYQKYTDFVLNDNLMLRFSFGGAVLDRVYGEQYGRSTDRVLLRTLGELAELANARVRGATFNVYCGDLDGEYVVAVPRSTPVTVCRALESEFRHIEGFTGSGQGRGDELAPAYRWESGRIIVYAGENEAGTARRLSAVTGQESDVLVHLRCARPAEEIGRECYGGLDYEFLDARPGPAPLVISLFDGEWPVTENAFSSNRARKPAGSTARRPPRRRSRLSPAQLPLDFHETE